MVVARRDVAREARHDRHRGLPDRMPADLPAVIAVGVEVWAEQGGPRGDQGPLVIGPVILGERVPEIRKHVVDVRPTVFGEHVDREIGGPA